MYALNTAGGVRCSLAMAYTKKLVGRTVTPGQLRDSHPISEVRAQRRRRGTSAARRPVLDAADAFELLVDTDEALDVFNHAYAYAAFRGCPGSVDIAA
jgi:hypothetical protein